MEEITSKKLKSMAKGQLVDKYHGLSRATLSLILFVVLLALLVNNVTPKSETVNAWTVICQIIASVMENILVYGYTAICLKAVCDMPFRKTDLFEGFKDGNWKAVAITELLLMVLLAVVAAPGGALLVLYFFDRKIQYIALAIALIIIGAAVYIYLEVMFSFRFLCMLDFPSRGPLEYLKLSRDILKGHFWKLLYIKLSFIPWKLVIACSMGIAGLWLKPYIKATEINYYLYLMSKRR